MIHLAISILAFLFLVWCVGVLIIGFDSIYLEPGRNRPRPQRKPLWIHKKGKIAPDAKILIFMIVGFWGTIALLSLI